MVVGRTSNRSKTPGQVIHTQNQAFARKTMRTSHIVVTWNGLCCLGLSKNRLDESRSLRHATEASNPIRFRWPCGVGNNPLTHPQTWLDASHQRPGHVLGRSLVKDRLIVNQNMRKIFGKRSVIGRYRFWSDFGPRLLFATDAQHRVLRVSKKHDAAHPWRK